MADKRWAAWFHFDLMSPKALKMSGPSLLSCVDISMAGFLVVIWGIFAFTALLMRWNAMKYRQKGLPPGTMGLPVIGETLEFLKQGPNFMRRQRARYGNFFKTHILGSPTIISLDPEVNRYILLNEGKGLLPGYPQSLLDMLGKYNIASAHGPDHRFVRGTLISLISPTIIKDQLLLKCDEFMLSYLSNWDGKTIDIQDRTKDMILMLMLKMIANVESGPIPEAFKPEFLTLIDGTISLPLNIPGTHYYNGLKARENIISIIRRMIKERRACPSSQPDMLDSLLQIEDSNHKKISDENIIDQVITIIHSGYETVSTTTMMIIKYLHDHPKALQDLRVIFETLRLAAVTNGGMRKTTRDMELNDTETSGDAPRVACRRGPEVAACGVFRYLNKAD
ncbi:hypothetical protein Syun_020447 [Stephania yunnanensis]|uniref:Cytochrome P450 n=1 Tax=Stephania yunnanensis TaxID=152371 RepID=A0AAP0NQ09_9MAGN